MEKSRKHDMYDTSDKDKEELEANIKGEIWRKAWRSTIDTEIATERDGERNWLEERKRERNTFT